uniref:Uncharacterized protein n=1 Tax=Cereibacter sphaeroides (strain ATCC 17025 / ATH 2.4.3) TaxID=349102 RepID=A4WTG5_CERS5
MERKRLSHGRSGCGRHFEPCTRGGRLTVSGHEHLQDRNAHVLRTLRRDPDGAGRGEAAQKIRQEPSGIGEAGALGKRKDNGGSGHGRKPQV